MSSEKFSEELWKIPELSNNAFYFSSVGWNSPEPSPVVGLHGKVSECEKTQNGSAPIANDDVKDPVIPPAFGEIWQLWEILPTIDYDDNESTTHWHITLFV